MALAKMKKKKIHMAYRCYLFHAMEESVDHLMFHCQKKLHHMKPDF